MKAKSRSLLMCASTLLVLAACKPNAPETAQPASTPAPAAASQTAATPNVSAEDAALLKQAQAIFKPLPTLAESQKLTNHYFTDAQVKLGQQLWHEPRLSLANDISCNSCHGLSTYGVDNKPVSNGHKNLTGDRNSPTALNAFLLSSQFWDGRAKDVEEQAKGPLVNPVEMANADLDAVVKKVNEIPAYVEQFKTIYADKDGGKVTIDNIAHAIGAFERTLLTPSKWDNYLKGDVNALNEQERRGLKSFMNNGCIACHTGVNLSSDSFQKFGLVKGPYWDYLGKDVKKDEGLFEQTKKESDKQFFRVPGLRNVEKTAPYFHSGSVNELSEAVRIMAELQLGKDLSKEEIDDIVAYLKTLTGEIPAEALKVPELPK